MLTLKNTIFALKKLMQGDQYEYDAFISYAVEDKIEVVNELVQKLESNGIKVWFTGQMLSTGKGIRETIKEGLKKSRHGIVVLSPHYLSKSWPKIEYNILWAKEQGNQHRILPVWHNVTADDLKMFDPYLDDNYGVSTEKGLDYVVNELCRSLKEDSQPRLSSKNNTKRRVLLSLSAIFIFLLLFTGYSYIYDDTPGHQLINKSIEKRINTFQANITNELNHELNYSKGKLSDINQIQQLSSQYDRIEAYYRNEFHLDTKYSQVSFKKHVAPALGIDMENLGPHNSYGFSNPEIYIFDLGLTEPAMDYKYVFLNRESVDFKIVEENKIDDYTYIVEVENINNIRLLSVHLTYSPNPEGIKRKVLDFKAFLPKEKYVFTKVQDDWQWTEIKPYGQ